MTHRRDEESLKWYLLPQSDPTMRSNRFSRCGRTRAADAVSVPKQNSHQQLIRVVHQSMYLRISY